MIKSVLQKDALLSDMPSPPRCRKLPSASLQRLQAGNDRFLFFPDIQHSFSREVISKYRSMCCHRTKRYLPCQPQVLCSNYSRVMQNAITSKNWFVLFTTCPSACLCSMLRGCQQFALYIYILKYYINIYYVFCVYICISLCQKSISAQHRAISLCPLCKGKILSVVHFWLPWASWKWKRRKDTTKREQICPSHTEFCLLSQCLSSLLSQFQGSSKLSGLIE